VADFPYNACYVGDDAAARQELVTAWGPDVARWTFFSTGREATGMLLTSPPDILICSLNLPDMPGLDVAKLLKEENIYSQVPVVLYLSLEEADEYTDWVDLIADDFVVFPSPNYIIRARLELAIARPLRTLDANPLSRLPGNTSIIKQTQRLIDRNQDFALLYCDLDYFKPFNDKYGFARGDEVLMMTARIIHNAVHNQNLPVSFVGHIGGDDFVCIVPIAAAERVCKTIVADFDSIIPQFYDAEDIVRNSILSVDRQNKVCTFSLMSISIAVVFNINGSLGHYGKASSRAVELKRVAKKFPTSSYVMDQRRS